MSVFVINSSSVDSHLQVLVDLKAVHVKGFDAWKDDCGCGCGDICFAYSVKLPQGDKFKIPQKVSKHQLKKIFGSDAMVRGVKHS